MMESRMAYKGIIRIEQELRILKKMLVSQKKIVPLKGLLKGTKITEDEIEDAKKSLFRA